MKFFFRGSRGNSQGSGRSFALGSRTSRSCCPWTSPGSSRSNPDKSLRCFTSTFILYQINSDPCHANSEVQARRLDLPGHRGSRADGRIYFRISIRHPVGVLLYSMGRHAGDVPRAAAAYRLANDLQQGKPLSRKATDRFDNPKEHKFDKNLFKNLS